MMVGALLKACVMHYIREEESRGTVTGSMYVDERWVSPYVRHRGSTYICACYEWEFSSMVFIAWLANLLR